VTLRYEYKRAIFTYVPSFLYHFHPLDIVYTYIYPMHSAFLYAVTVTVLICSTAADPLPTDIGILGTLSRLYHFRPAGPGSICIRNFRSCGSELTCKYYTEGALSKFGVGVCYRTVQPGYPCLQKFIECDKHSKCVSIGKLKQCIRLLKKNEKCGSPKIKFAHCHPGLKCVGPQDRKLCMPPLDKGKFCTAHKDAYKFCATGLTCFKDPKHTEPSKCYGVMQPGQKCDGKFMACTTGHRCVGPDGHKKCRAPVGKGASCYGGYNYCASGLTCAGTGTSKKCVKVMGVYGLCSGENMVCHTGLSCVGPTATTKKCVPPIRKGYKCDNKYHFCPEGLRCFNSRCVKFMGRGGDCAMDHMPCYPGLKCLPVGNTKKCYRPVPKGFYCKHPRLPFLICTKPSVCIGNGVRARCIGLMNEGGSCEGRYMFCNKGLYCVGVPGSRTCKSAAPKGGVCGGVKHGKCDKGLVCYSKSQEKGHCFAVSGAYEKCDKQHHIICGPALYCNKHHKCVPKAMAGEPCETSPDHRLCEDGHSCVDHRCYKVVSLNYSCEGPVKCSEGLVCAGVQGLRQCVKPRALAEECGNDPYVVCGKKLKCTKYHGKFKCKPIAY